MLLCIDLFLFCIIHNCRLTLIPPQPARYQFPNFQTRLRSFIDGRIILCKTNSDPIWFWLAVRCWPKRIRSGSKPVFKNHPARFWPMLPQPIRVRCESDPAYLLGCLSSGMFTGLFVLRHVYWVVCPPACLLGCLSSDMFTGLFVLRHVYWVVSPLACLLGCLSSGMFTGLFVLGHVYWVVCPSVMFTGLCVLRHVYWVVCPRTCLLGCLSSGMFTGLFVLGHVYWVVCPRTCLLGCLSSVTFTGLFVLRHVYWVVCPPSCLLGCLSSDKQKRRDCDSPIAHWSFFYHSLLFSEG